MDINKMKNLLSDFNEAIEKLHEAKKEKDPLEEKEKEIADIFANAIAVALAQVENLIQDEFDSSTSALRFSDSMLAKMRRRYRSELSKAMRRFDRLGSHRTAVLMRKKLNKL